MPRLTAFAGLAPKIDSQDGAPAGASVAENCELYGGRIEPMPGWRNAGRVVGIDGELFEGEVRTLHKAGPVWVGFPEHTFVAPDPAERGGEGSFLFVQDGRLWRSSATWVMSKLGPEPVGIETPCESPQAAVLAGAGVAEHFPLSTCDAMPDPNDVSCAPGAHPPEARAYVFTYVTDCDEESAPSTPSEIVDVEPGDNVMLLDPGTPPANATRRRWYRSVSTTDGLATWLFVGESGINQPGFVDDVSPLALGDVLDTEGHLPPPPCLEGVALIGDATVVVWANNQFWLSEPRLPHAYPPLWRKELPHKILAMVGATAPIESAETWLGYAVTDGRPYLLTGVSPEDMVPREYEVWEPGASRHCVAVVDGGIVYASTQALIELRGPNAQSVLDPEVMDLQWQDFDPAGLRLAFWNAQLWGFSERAAFRLPGSHYREDRGRYLTTMTSRATAVFSAPDVPLTLAGPKTFVRQVDPAKTQRFRWRTRVFTMPGQWWPAAAKVVADWPRESRELKAARQAYAVWAGRFGGCLHEFLEARPEYARFEPELGSLRRSITVSLYADGQLYYSREVSSSEPFRLPKRRGIDWQFEVAGDLPVKEIHWETSIQDLVQLGLGVGNSV